MNPESLVMKCKFEATVSEVFHNCCDFTAQLSSNLYKYCDLRNREEAIVSPGLSFLKLEIVILYEKLKL